MSSEHTKPQASNKFQLSVKTKNIAPEDKVIVFMGPTGSGKSTILERLIEGVIPSNGEQLSLSGAQLSSYTQDINIVRIKHPKFNYYLVLVDTPGFDDTNKSDMDILKVISKFLVNAYQKKIKLTGLVYLQRITDNRIVEALHRSFHVFTEICGTSAMKHVALVTTMWDELKEDEGLKREEEVVKSLWGNLERSDNHLRFKNTAESAWEIVDHLIKNEPTGPNFKLDLQEELGEKRKSLHDTKAAFALHTPLTTILEKKKPSSTESPTTNEELINTFNKAQEEVDNILRQAKSNQRQSLFVLRVRRFLNALNFTTFSLASNPNKEGIM